LYCYSHLNNNSTHNKQRPFLFARALSTACVRIWRCYGRTCIYTAGEKSIFHVCLLLFCIFGTETTGVRPSFQVRIRFAHKPAGSL
jgi:hypothetical protein